ncbi:hypothetical protein V2J09_023496 [Rumex salicifolius]
MAAAKAAPPVNKVEMAHQLYRDGQYDEALELYTDALSTAKTRIHKIALHSNRAACYLKLHDFKKAADECTSVLELDNKHTGALMLRAQTLVALKEYQFALFDVSRLLDINPLSEVYMELQSRLKTQLSLAPIPESEAEVEEEEEEESWKEEPKEVRELKLAEEAKQRDHALASTNQKEASSTRKSVAPQRQSQAESSTNQTIGWKAIPKPLGHSKLDYSRWDKVESDSSEDDEDEDSDDEDDHPRYRFRVKV